MPTAARSRSLDVWPTWAIALVVPVIAAVAVVVTLTVTDGGDGGAVAAGTPTTGEDAVTIQNFDYSPDPLEVAVGTEVTVTNADGAAHTLTADDGSFDTGNLDGGATGTITVATAGRYTYFCDIHNYMTGVIEAR